MHNIHVTADQESSSQKHITPITDWIRPIVLKKLPHSTSDTCKIVSEFIRVQSHHVEMVDCYANYYNPNRYTIFEEQIAYQIKLLASPNFSVNPYNDYSPFVPQKREVITTNPSLTGQSSTSSATGSASSSCDENPSSDDEAQLLDMASPNEYPSEKKKITFDSVLSSMKDVYGMDLGRPKRESQKIYRAYVQMGRKAKTVDEGYSQSPAIKSHFKPKDYANLMDPKVPAGDMIKYSNYLLIPERYAKNSLDTNMDLLRRYINVDIC